MQNIDANLSVVVADQYRNVAEERNGNTRMRTRHAYEGIISVNVRKPSGKVWDEFARKVVEKLQDPAFEGKDNPVIDDPKEASNETIGNVLHGVCSLGRGLSPRCHGVTFDQLT